MPGYINHSGNYSLDGFGLVHVITRHNLRRITARWKGPQLKVYAPTGIEADALTDVLQQMRPAIDRNKPEAPYALGQCIDFPDFSVDISSQKHAPDRMFLTVKDKVAHIEVGTKWDIEQAVTIKQITKFICRVAQSMAPAIILPQAKEVALSIGKEPLMWTISNGHRTLGRCNVNGEIALSYALLFYPRHLRHYVICHELAHLTEMNHSQRFRALCDQYLNGQLEAMEAELRSIRLPIPRL